MAPELEIIPCDPARDGELIRSLTRANFYAAMKSVWNEARHQQEPLHPDRYRMVRVAGEPIGFFATHAADDRCLYLQTIQLVESARGAGIGTQLMHHIRALAVTAGARAIRLRVFRSNEGACRFYRRLGFTQIGEDDLSLLLELALAHP